MSSKRNHEGYFLLDHSQTEAVPDKIMLSVGLPAGSGRGRFETATFTCNHCKTVVIKNPKRNKDKPRCYCKTCDHFICDGCGVTMAVTGVCVTFDQLVDQTREAVEKQSAPPSLILLQP